MFPSLNCRCGHYALLLVVTSALNFPTLGTPSLWDIDEGNNAEAAREMLESGNWVVPTFNYQLRVDKPALLYWLQIGAYHLFGVNELAARFPSALAALATVLLTYELGRQMFGAATGLLAGVVLASTIAFCIAAHFANPDALLNAFTLLTLFFFWRGYARKRRGWFVPAGISAGLAVLAKGPVGVVLPGAVIGLYLIWSREWCWDRWLLFGCLAFALTALPWYIWVAADTKADFLRGFLLTHNVGRYLHPMENHRGPIFYYLGVLVLGFAPWSIFLGPASWFALGKHARNDGEMDSPALYRFLWCWIMVYLVFFSLAGTKLPNYILPIYAPIALLIARSLNRWQRGTIQRPTWALHVSLGCLMLMGIGTSLAMLLAGGVIDLPILHSKHLPGLENGAILGMLPAAGAVIAWWCLRRQNRGGVVLATATVAVLFTGALLAWGGVAVDAHKAPRVLVELSQARQTEREVRVGCYQYFQPSLVFYCQREVQRLDSEAQALEFLRCPLQVYLFVPASAWRSLEGKVRGPYHLLAQQRDLYRRYEVVVVTNR
jgi:4-amino-4-deoxy-L-arabinose transferase-like glycosyltransferase